MPLLGSGRRRSHGRQLRLRSAAVGWKFDGHVVDVAG